MYVMLFTYFHVFSCISCYSIFYIELKSEIEVCTYRFVFLVRFIRFV